MTTNLSTDGFGVARLKKSFPAQSQRAIRPVSVMVI
jgi:hypothetical protein